MESNTILSIIIAFFRGRFCWTDLSQIGYQSRGSTIRKQKGCTHDKEKAESVTGLFLFCRIPSYIQRSRVLTLRWLTHQVGDFCRDVVNLLFHIRRVSLGSLTRGRGMVSGRRNKERVELYHSVSWLQHYSRALLRASQSLLRQKCPNSEQYQLSLIQ